LAGILVGGAPPTVFQAFSETETTLPTTVQEPVLRFEQQIRVGYGTKVALAINNVGINNSPKP
jgi:hypothetical protein